MKQEIVTFKGNREGLLVILSDKALWDEIIERLKSRLQGKEGSFFEGASVVIDTGARTLTSEEVAEIWNTFEENGLKVKSIKSETNKVVSECKEGTEGRKSRERTGPEQELVSKLPSLIVKRNVRSGQKITFPGNVIILGDVNPGAEVMAKGSIVVMGTLRGIAHAGVEGDEDVLVTSLRLKPTQLRIAGFITRAPEEEPSEPEVAQVVNGMIICEGIEKIRKSL
ncbi:MAG: septum site-determining protein MinC [Bacillota bacterium]|uniref:Probable septum site-determining protein MinC n=1 Tax=Thermanaerosceptrum fracticalcis TaxID=1712410 RepID=A0A7G6E681_THEFR|nr:septum site-determining protein MinC [Thermanaerosceptrum fracticalcis]QNB47585.1 septum site-determining protein MinC [Thermanaerosceptrum fracticalcis]